MLDPEVKEPTAYSLPTIKKPPSIDSAKSLTAALLWTTTPQNGSQSHQTDSWRKFDWLSRRCQNPYSGHHHCQDCKKQYDINTPPTIYGRRCQKTLPWHSHDALQIYAHSNQHNPTRDHQTIWYLAISTQWVHLREHLTCNVWPASGLHYIQYSTHWTLESQRLLPVLPHPWLVEAKMAPYSFFPFHRRLRRYIFREEHADHLIASIEEHYEFSKDWGGTLYCGIKIK